MVVENIPSSRLDSLRWNPLERLIEQNYMPTAFIITRDGCVDCEKFEPNIPDLDKMFKNRVDFKRIHVNYSENDYRESDRIRSTLKIAGYHTVIIYVPSLYGNLESYRETEPEVERVTEQINKAIDRTERYQNELLI